MAQTQIPANNRGLISTFGQYYNRSSNSFSGIFGTATYPQRSLSNLNMGYFSSGTYMIYVNAASSNSTKGSIAITYPFSQSSSGTSIIGNDRQVHASTYGYIGLQAYTNYGYTWKGWYTLPSGGTFLSDYVGPSIGVGSYTGVWYAQWY
jgi:hypothetical protein